MVTRDVTALDLAVGDRVINHGGIFEVYKVTRYSAHDGEREPVQANISRFVRDLSPRHTCAVPESWRADWNLQGNHRARYTVVVE